MNIPFNQAFGGGGGGSAQSFVLSFTESKSYTVPYRCTVDLAIGAAAGSGASNSIALGGNSGPCGFKRLDLEKDEVLTIEIGAGGASVTGANGLSGGTTTVKLNGTTVLTATGGEGGLGAASGALSPAAITASITGADVWFPGIQAGAVTAGTASRTGGAAANFAGVGLGRSSSLSTNGEGAGGSVGSDSLTATPQTAPLAAPTVALFSFGVFPRAEVGKGGNGVNGGGEAGGFGAGGGAGGNTGAGGAGGQCGGGGACGAGVASGRGGSGYVCATITKAI